jgi:hypothetical protein
MTYFSKVSPNIITSIPRSSYRTRCDTNCRYVILSLICFARVQFSSQSRIHKSYIWCNPRKFFSKLMISIHMNITSLFWNVTLDVTEVIIRNPRYTYHRWCALHEVDLSSDIFSRMHEQTHRIQISQLADDTTPKMIYLLLWTKLIFFSFFKVIDK